MFKARESDLLLVRERRVRVAASRSFNSFFHGGLIRGRMGNVFTDIWRSST